MAEIQAFEKVVRCYLKNRTIDSTETGQKHYSGHIDSEEEYVNFISDLKAIGFSFATRTSGNNRSSRLFCSMVYPKNNLLNIPFLGVPFQIVKSRYLVCSLGSHYYKICSHDDLKKNRYRSQRTSKKFGCSAFLSMKCIRLYQGYELDEDPQGSKDRAKVMEKLKRDLSSKSPPKSTLRYLIIMSQAEDHNHSVVTTNLNQTIHPKIKAEIHNLVNQGVSSIQTMKPLLEMYVEQMCKDSKTSLPDRLNRRFYPKDKVISGYMHSAFLKLMMSPADEAALEAFIEAWKTESPYDRFFFRPGNFRRQTQDMQNDVNPSMLFCQQTNFQQDQLLQYGNNASLLDAAYKTARLNLPLFHICVKTSSGYITVGAFIIPFVTSAAISEALSVFLRWNPDWQPKYFLTSFSTVEIAAIEQTFPESAVYISSFHRDQLWGRWFNRIGNAPHGAEGHIRALWTILASADSEREFEVKLDTMYADPVFQECGDKLKQFFTSEMLPHARRWVKAFMNKDCVLHYQSRGLVQKQPNPLSHKHLLRLPDQTLTGIVTVVLTATRLQDVHVDSELPTDECEAMLDYECELLVDNEVMEISNSSTPDGLELSATAVTTLSPSVNNSSVINQLSNEHSYFMIAPKPRYMDSADNDSPLLNQTEAEERRPFSDTEEMNFPTDSGPDPVNNVSTALQKFELVEMLVARTEAMRSSTQDRFLLENIRSQVCEKLTRLTSLTMQSDNVNNLKESLDMLNRVERKIAGGVSKQPHSGCNLGPNSCVKKKVVVLQHVSSSKPVVIKKLC